MTKQKKAKKSSPQKGVTYKTKEDFLRWYHKQQARKKKRAKED